MLVSFKLITERLVLKHLSVSNAEMTGVLCHAEQKEVLCLLVLFLLFC